MKLAVGDAVVYAAHGAGRVAAREQRTVLGVEREVVVLELGHGLWVTLPIEQARERLRPVASEADVQRVQQTLHQDRLANEESWRQRLKQGQAKLASGDPLELAELVRQSSRRPSGGCMCRRGSCLPERSARRADSKRLRRTPGSRSRSRQPSRRASYRLLAAHACPIPSQ